MQAVQHKTVNRAATVQKPAASLKGVQRKAVAAKGSIQLQSSLKVSSPKDPAEKEADVTAKKIMRMAVPESSIAYVRTGSEGVFRQVKKEEKEKKIQAKLQSPYITRFANTGIFTQPKKKEEEKIQRKAEGQPNVASNVAADIQSSMAAGSPLPLSVRRFMEPRFQANFSNVKIQTGDKAAKLNRQLNAQAFTMGNQIFFGKDKFQPEQSEGKELIAHELTHTIQQGAAIQRSEDVTVTQQSPPQVQRLGLSDALDYFADKANLIPGFRMFTIILGVNPINMSTVDRSAANILRAIVEFIPGGGLITRALDNYGVFEKVGAWVEQQIKTLGMVGSAFKQAISQFLDWRDIFDLGGVWNRAKRIFTDPIDRIINFAKGLITGILKFIKEAILKPLAALAQGTRGYDLLKAILGEDPVTGEPVPRNADTLIGGFMKLIGQEEVWENIKKGNAIARAWAWFQGALAGLLGFVRSIPRRIIDIITSLTIQDVVSITGVFSKVVGALANIAGEFISWGLKQVISLLEILFSVVAPGVMPYIKKAQAAFMTILKNPIGFVGNLVRAGKLGFQMFADNILTHLKAALIKWLVGPLAEAGVYIPQSFSLIEIVKLVLSVLGLTWQNIRSKLVKIIPEPVLIVLEKTAGILVTLVKDGPAAAWEQIKAELNELKDQLIAQVTQMISIEVVKAAIMKLVSMLNPAGAVVQAIIAIYNTVTFFIEKINQIAAVVASFIDSISAIAAGQVANAAKKVETTMANTLVVVIAFLAKFAGLGNIPNKVVGIVKKIRAPIDKGLDKIVAWLGKMLEKAKALFGKKDKMPAQNVASPPNATSITVTESFNMLSASHTLTTRASENSVQVTMASNGGDLGGKIIKLIQAINDPKKVIRGDKEQVKNQLNEIAKKLADYGEKKKAYEKKLGVGVEGTLRPVPKDFAREYSNGLISEIVKLAEKFGFTDLVAQTFLPDPLPVKRYIPEPIKSKIRQRLYERGSDWVNERERVVLNRITAIDNEIANRIIKPRNAGDTNAASDAMKDMKNRGKVLEDAALTHFTAGHSYVTPNLGKYAVDHDPSLAEHWVKHDGNMTSDADRQKTVEGKGISKLDLVTRRFNSQKSSRDISGELQRFKKHAWISPPFTTTIGKDVKGTSNNTDVVTIDDHSLTHEDGTPYLPS